MSERTNRPLVLVGCGRRIGINTAKLFALKRFNVFALISRSEEHLKQWKAELEAVMPGKLTVTIYVVDVIDTKAFTRVLDTIEKDLGVPEHVNYNAASVYQTVPFEISDEDLMYEVKTNVLGLHTIARWAIRMFDLLKEIDPTVRPSMLVASSLLPGHPLPGYFHIGVAKAAQRNLILYLHMAFGEKFDLGMLLVPRLVLPEDDECNAPNVAICAWKWYSFPPGERPMELQVSVGGK